VVDVLDFFFSSRRRHTSFACDWSSDVCSSDLLRRQAADRGEGLQAGPSIPPVKAFSAVSGLATKSFSLSAARTRTAAGSRVMPRSEERRVGKEWGAEKTISRMEEARGETES